MDTITLPRKFEPSRAVYGPNKNRVRSGRVVQPLRPEDEHNGWTQEELQAYYDELDDLIHDSTMARMNQKLRPTKTVSRYNHFAKRSR